MSTNGHELTLPRTSGKAAKKMGVASPAEATQLRKVLLFLLVILTLFLYSRASLALEASGITVTPPVTSHVRNSEELHRK